MLDHAHSEPAVDVITQGVVRESLASIVREMRGMMIRSSYSAIIYEGFDFSCAILGADGRLIAQSSEDHPFHVIPVAHTVRHLLARCERTGHEIAESEIFLHNDPFTGGTHLNDVAVIWPLFQSGRRVAFIVIRSHWADIGGTTPGSLSGAASEILHEGLRLDCTRAEKAGGGPVLDLIRDNVRVSDEAMADFNVVLATCRVAERRLDALFDRYGLGTVLNAADGLLQASARRMRARISALPDGTYRGVGYLDGNDPALFPLSVTVALTVDGDRLTADFSGTQKQVPAPLNAGVAIAATSVLTIIKSFLDPSGVINGGTTEPIEVFAPPGTILNAQWPAPCGGLNEVRFAADAAVMGALAKFIPEALTGDVRGTSNHTYIGGTDVRRGRDYIFYEYPSGGTGGFAGHDGNPAVRAFNEGENVSIQSAEVIETIYPLKVRRNELRPDSGGAGRWRGGVGLWREVELIDDRASLSVLSDRNLVPPAGVNGGRSGAGNRTTVRRNGREIEPSSFPGKIAGFGLQKGDVLVMQSSGGGGFGPPSERDPAALAADIADGIVTNPAPYARDPADEVKVQVAVASSDLSAKLVRVGAAVRDTLSLSDGQMVEIVPQKGAIFRFWVDETPAHDAQVVEVSADLELAGPVALRATANAAPGRTPSEVSHG
ncbi:MAG: hydantoinase B/oxoprolinase family protein [Pseudomonadota bacterium]